MASILKLPDEVLIRIYKMLDRDEQQYSWANVCKRFQYIYFRYFHNWTELNDNLAQNFGHLIGTGEFPLRIIKTLNLSKSKCTKVFLNKLRDCHKEIEEAKLFSFTDEFLAELLPLPNLKKLICIGACNLRGSSLIDLNSLTELHIHTNSLFDPENLLQIAYHNPLKTLVMPNDPQTFSNRYAFELVENLKNVEELTIAFYPCKSWQLIGTLPKLKKLELWDFFSEECELCLEDPNSCEVCGIQYPMPSFDELYKRNQLEELVIWQRKVSELHQKINRNSKLTNLQRLNSYKAYGSQHAIFFDELCKRNQPEKLWSFDRKVTEQHLLRISELTNLPGLNSHKACRSQHAMLFFDELCKRNQLEELVFGESKVSEQHLLRISELTNLQRLKFCITSMPRPLSLDVLKDLVNLEELQLDDCHEVNAEGSLELIRRCQKLKILNFCFAFGITVNFLTEANDILSQRQPPSTEPLTLAFDSPEILPTFQTLENPLPFLKFITVTRKFADAEEDYLTIEEDIVSQTDVEGHSLNRKFRV